MTDATHARAIVTAAEAFNAAVQQAHAAGLQVQVIVGAVCTDHDHPPCGPLVVGGVFRVTKIDPGIGAGGSA